MPSSHLILCRPLLLLPPIPPSIRVFSNESTLHMRWPKYWSFSFSIIPSTEIPGLISFRMDWLDLLAVQGTLKSLLQHRSSKALILQCSAFFTAQLSHPYMTTGKTIALTRWTFVGKVMSVLFNMLSGLVLPRKCTGHSKHPLPTTQEKTLHIESPDGQHWNQIDYILCSQRWRSLYTVSKNKTGSWLWLRSWTPLLPNSDLNWRKWGKPLDHSGMT